MNAIEVEVVPKEQKLYTPRGGAAAMMLAREPEVILTGPAGTGKTRCVLEKLYACALKYPGMRGLILRQTRESLTETGLVTWEEKVVPKGHPCLIGPQRRLRSSYSFPNGSEVIVGGLGTAEKVAKIMSSEYDLIVVLEATELREHDWESLTTRLRNGKMPYQQIIADCNPGPPTHWLKNREVRKVTRHIESRHEDNPVIWSTKDNKPTPAGEAYIAKLDNLTGHRKLRLRFGKWAQAEGVVYPEWDTAIHIIDPFRVPSDWERYWVCDFGYDHPFVWQNWAENGDGDVFMTREIFMSQVIVEDHARRILELTEGENSPRDIICDHDAEGRATLERYLKRSTIPAQKAVDAGIQDVMARLRPNKNGKPRMFFFRGALDRVDTRLLDSASATSTAAEFDGYVWDPRLRKGEQPLKQHDDGMDCVRYLARHLANRPTGTVAGIRMGGGSLVSDAPAGVFNMV